MRGPLYGEVIGADGVRVKEGLAFVFGEGLGEAFDGVHPVAIGGGDAANGPV